MQGPLQIALDILASALTRGAKQIPNLPPGTAVKLGRVLRDIAWGADPEPLRWKKEAPDPRGVAYFYHYYRAVQKLSDTKAIARLQGEDGITLAASSVRKYAQTHRDAALSALKEGRWVFDLSNDDEATARLMEFAAETSREHRMLIASYCEYLRKKSPREHVERRRS